MKPEFEARVEVQTVPADYDGEISTNCQAVRIRNLSTTAPLIANVSGTPFAVAPGSSWGVETGDVRAVILRPFRVKTGAATALVERIFLTQL